jgi:DNA-binding CsgD family transcriptional regulator
MRFGLTERESEIIRYLLAQRGIGAYEIVRPLNEGRDLPGCTYQAEVEEISGYIATATSAYDFWLVWYNGNYSLGDYPGGFWSELDPPMLADSRDGDMVEILEAQHRLRREEQTPSRFSPRSMTRVQEKRKDLPEGSLSGREEVILGWLLEKQEITTYEIVGATPLGGPLARYTLCPFPPASHQTVRASFNAYSFPFVHSEALRRVSCPVWIA